MKKIQINHQMKSKVKKNQKKSKSKMNPKKKNQKKNLMESSPQKRKKKNDEFIANYHGGRDLYNLIKIFSSEMLNNNMSDDPSEESMFGFLIDIIKKEIENHVTYIGSPFRDKMNVSYQTEMIV